MLQPPCLVKCWKSTDREKLPGSPPLQFFMTGYSRIQSKCPYLVTLKHSLWTICLSQQQAKASASEVLYYHAIKNLCQMHWPSHQFSWYSMIGFTMLDPSSNEAVFFSVLHHHKVSPTSHGVFFFLTICLSLKHAVSSVMWADKLASFQ